MPESDPLLLQCSYVYPQTGKKCLNEIKNEMINYCSLHLVLKCDNKNVDIYNQQNNLEEKTNYLIKRIKRLQNKQLYKHVNIQLSAFVKYQQEQMNVSCLHPFIIHQELLNKNLVLSSLNSLPGISQEDKLKLLSHENIKTLPTSQLVKLFKKKEQNNSNIKQNNIQNQQNFLIHHNSINTNKLTNDQQSNINDQNQIKNELLNNLNNIKKENLSSPQQQVSLQPNISKVDNQNLSTSKEEANKNRKLPNNKFGNNIIVNRKSVAPKFTSDQIKQINNTVGIIKNNLKHLEYSYDSDATESSSGGESCDEFDDYLNDLCKQQKIDHNSITTVPLSQKANWKWALERGAIASRWTWLQAQVSDLDFKIRQQNEMYKQFRSNKGPISFYSNESNQPINGEPQSCVRTLPLKQMKKRKLVRSVYALSTANRKIARYSTVLCSCNSLPSLANSCVLCNDRYSYVQMIDTDCMPISERIALLDASYHSVLSLRENISLGLHFSKLLKKETVQRPMIKTNNYKKKKICQKNINTSELTFKFKNELKSKKKSQAFIQSTKLKKKYEGTNKKHQLLNKKSRNVRLKSKVKDRFDNSNYSDESSRHDSPLPSPFTNENGSFISSSASSLHRRRRSEQNAFDINNIVIPYSIASTTRVEKLQYKEIITPKWRVTENEKKELEKLKELGSLEEIEKLDLDKNGSFTEKENSLIELPENNSLNDKEDSKQSLNNNSANNILVNDENSNSSESTDISDKNKSDSLEDLSDEIFIERHLKCEADEKKRFCTYLKNPIGNGSRGRGIRQRTESSKSESINLESNTIDNSSQDSFSNLPINLNINSTSKAISPGPDFIFEESSNQSTSKQRTFSLSRRDDFFEEENHIEIIPYEKRNFPLSEIEYNELTMYLDE